MEFPNFRAHDIFESNEVVREVVTWVATRFDQPTEEHLAVVRLAQDFLSLLQGTEHFARPRCINTVG